MRFVTAIGAVLGLLLHLLATAGVAWADGRDAITYWLDTQQQVERSRVLAGQSFAPNNSLPLNTAAMFNAVNATTGSRYVFFGQPVGASTARPDLAAAYASHTILSGLYPPQSADLNAALVQALTGSSAADQMAAQVTGQAAAQSVLNARAGAVATTPWLLPSANTFRAGPPPAVPTQIYLDDYNEVKTLGVLNGSTRTPAQTDIADFWKGGTTIFFTIADMSQTIGFDRISDEAEFARYMALVGLGIGDASITALESKMFYNTPRPITAIRAGDSDANPATAGDATWTAFGTNIPAGSLLSYPSGGGALDGFLGRLIPALVATNTIDEDFSNGVMTRHYSQIDAMFQEAGESRILVGEHFRFDVEGGRLVGRDVAGYYVTNALQPIPEPPAVLMMLTAVITSLCIGTCRALQHFLKKPALD